MAVFFFHTNPINPKKNCQTSKFYSMSYKKGKLQPVARFNKNYASQQLVHTSPGPLVEKLKWNLCNMMLSLKVIENINLKRTKQSVQSIHYWTWIEIYIPLKNVNFRGMVWESRAAAAFLLRHGNLNCAFYGQWLISSSIIMLQTVFSRPPATLDTLQK